MSALSAGPLTAGERADLRTVNLPSRLDIKSLDRGPDFRRFIRDLVAEWATNGRISDPKAGFGFATSGVINDRVLWNADPEDPRTYIATAFTDGEVPERYKWNAVRKIYELVHLLHAGHDIPSTLEAVRHHPQLLRPAVPSENPDGTVPWGPFSRGGAVIRRRRSSLVLCAFSIWKQQEDDDVAREGADWMLRMFVPA